MVYCCRTSKLYKRGRHAGIVWWAVCFLREYNTCTCIETLALGSYAEVLLHMCLRCLVLWSCSLVVCVITSCHYSVSFELHSYIVSDDGPNPTSTAVFRSCRCGGLRGCTCFNSEKIGCKRARHDSTQHTRSILIKILFTEKQHFLTTLAWYVSVCKLWLDIQLLASNAWLHHWSAKLDL